MRLLIFVLAVAVLPAQESGDKDAALGAQLAGEVRSHSPAIDNVAVRDYVDRVGQKLASFTGAVRYQFDVIADPSTGRTHEPAALPGGYILVSTDLILAAHDEGEFAGMLAHAMAHSAAYPVERPQMTNGSIPLIFVGGWGESPVVPLSSIKAHRAAELDADRVAVQTMAAAGYDPMALVRYIEHTQPASNQLFSALPPRAERVDSLKQAIDRAIGQLPSKSYSMSEDFGRIQDAVRIPPIPVPHAPTLFRPDEQH
jgi:predicted Zn-dependent protease